MERIEKVRLQIDEILKSQSNTATFIHLYSVSQLSSLLALRRGLNVEICAIAGMLHDIYSFKNGYVKNHAQLGAVIAKDVLTEINCFSENEIALITNAIENHSDKKSVHDEYSELLKDADALQNYLYEMPSDPKNRKRIRKSLKELGLKKAQIESLNLKKAVL